MKICIAQLLVTKDIQQNTEKILKVLRQSNENDWVVFPEGMLSGYYPEDDQFTLKLDWPQIEAAVEEITLLVSQKSVRCIFGTALLGNGKWYNAALFIDKSGVKHLYKKANLSTLDRTCFVAGNRLDVHQADGVTFGIQLCRDNAFPEQWLVLKQKGAQVVFHINNAIKREDSVRSHLLISRAFENQYFVVSVNNAADTQTLPSLVVSPSGTVLYESQPKVESIGIVELDMLVVTSDYLEQKRTDLVEVLYIG